MSTSAPVCTIPISLGTKAYITERYMRAHEEAARATADAERRVRDLEVQLISARHSLDVARAKEHDTWNWTAMRALACELPAEQRSPSAMKRWTVVLRNDVTGKSLGGCMQVFEEDR